MKWFKHETNASQDAKLKRLRMRYGLEGLGLYWYCLELIGQTVEPHNLTFELEHDAEVIADDVNVHIDHIQEMMRYMIDLELFEQNGIVVTCLKMAIRADEYTQKSIRNNGISGQTPDKLPTKSGHAPDKVPSNRKKEEKEEKDIRRFTPPTLKEVTEYISEKGYQIDPEQFIAHYESVNWFRGKTKIKDWKACVRTWLNNAKNKNPSLDDYGKGGI